MAAITIVAYNGVTARANTTSAQSAAATVIKKVEIYNAEEAGYPTAFSQLTTASQTEAFHLTGVTVSGTAIAAQPTSPNTVNLWRCPATGTITGMMARYWKYDGTVGLTNLTTGTGAPATGTTGCAIVAS
ncbi:hypothetical protein B7Y94_06025 [Candidatus Saccharibacteria bacterium 32-49-12]|nr:MAG: hypothetical protein B7Y94_06025 [Candidatus Saccharibacteria bacterium 32-49-12]